MTRFILFTLAFKSYRGFTWGSSQFCVELGLCTAN